MNICVVRECGPAVANENESARVALRHRIVFQCTRPPLAGRFWVAVYAELRHEPRDDAEETYIFEKVFVQHLLHACSTQRRPLGADLQNKVSIIPLFAIKISKLELDAVWLVALCRFEVCVHGAFELHFGLRNKRLLGLRQERATRIWRDADEYCEEQDPELRRQTNWRTLMH